MIDGMANRRTIMVLPDLHAPIHNRQAWACFLSVLKDIQPDELHCLGDYLDQKAPARWSKGTAAEYANNLFSKEIPAGRKCFAQVRDVYDGRYTIQDGNHCIRYQKYVERYAPAVAGCVPPMSELLGYKGFGVEHVGTYGETYNIAPGVLAIHGNALSSVLGGAGQSAFKERIRHGVSIVQGHSHRLGLGFDRQDKSRFWLEAGCLMSYSAADYVAYPGQVNWQYGFALLHVVGSKVFPEIHRIEAGITVVSGRVFPVERAQSLKSVRAA